MLHLILLELYFKKKSFRIISQFFGTAATGCLLGACTTDTLSTSSYFPSVFQLLTKIFLLKGFKKLVSKQALLYSVIAVDSGKKAMELLGLNEGKAESLTVNVSYLF